MCSLCTVCVLISEHIENKMHLIPIVCQWCLLLYWALKGCTIDGTHCGAIPTAWFHTRPTREFQTQSFNFCKSSQFYNAMNLDQLNQPLNFPHASEHLSSVCIGRHYPPPSLDWFAPPCPLFLSWSPEQSTSTINKFEKKKFQNHRCMARIIELIFRFLISWGEKEFLDNCWIRATYSVKFSAQNQKIKILVSQFHL